MVFSPCMKFRANICHSNRDIAIKPIFKMAAAAILNLFPSLFLAHSRIWIVVLYVRVKFSKSNSTGGWVIKFCKKFKMATIRLLNQCVAMLDHPRSLTGARKPVFKCRLDRFGSFEDIVNGKFCKFGLLGSPKFTFWGFLPLNIIFHHRDTQKALPWRETRPMSHRAS